MASGTGYFDIVEVAIPMGLALLKVCLKHEVMGRSRTDS